MNKCFVKQIHI